MVFSASSMVSIFKYKNVKLFLSDELSRRVMQNSNYSLRAYARDLGMSTSRVSMFLRDDSPLSIKSAHLIAGKMKMSDNEKEYLLNLINYQFGKTALVRKNAWKLISKNYFSNTFSHQKNNFSIVLNEWYYAPLVEYVTADKPLKYESIALALGLDFEKFNQALHELEQSGEIIEIKPQKWVKNFSVSKFESPQKSEIIRRYHKTFLKKAAHCIDNQEIERRKFLTSVLRLRKEDVAQARKEIETFNQNFVKKYSNVNMTDVVYCLANQFYEIEGL